MTGKNNTKKFIFITPENGAKKIRKGLAKKACNFFIDNNYFNIEIMGI